MKNQLVEIKKTLGKPYADLELLLKLFAEVLSENNEPELAAQIPWITSNQPDFRSSGTEKLLHLYSICFQLLNLAEVNGAVQNRRIKQETNGLKSVNGLWGNVFNDLKNLGADEHVIIDQFKNVSVEPVLTAHPTEAKRPIVLSLYRELYLLLVKRENSMYTSYEQDEIKYDIKKILHKLWFIGEIFVEKPAVESELENVLHYFYNVFPQVLHYLDFKLKQAWENNGFNPALIDDTDNYPVITFGNWVGGDRDGHPLVTSDVTLQTLRKFRLHAFMLINELLDEISEKLSIYCDKDCLPANFRLRMEVLSNELGKPSINNTFEPFKEYVHLLKMKLPVIERPGGGIDIHDAGNTYKTTSELEEDLRLLKNALIEFGAESLAKYDVQFVLRHLKVFGFHLAHIDIRQNSKFYEEAFLDIVKTSLPYKYLMIKENNQSIQQFILEELNSNRPFINRIDNLGSEKAREILLTFHALAKHIRKYAADGLGSLIVSMTRNQFDLYTVYLFMREAGLSHYSPNGLVCPLPVVPLFETIDDLMNSPQILDIFLSHPVTQNSLEYIRKQKNQHLMVQEVMIGYSDSNKDGGIIASAWHLYYAQLKLTEIGKKHGVSIRFFHGKGGTISRGAGPTHWFLRSLPNETLNGLIRVTEQGETIERKYANKVNAAYNLELLMAGVTFQTVKNKMLKKETNEKRNELFSTLASESYNEFRSLTQNPSFIKFYEQATPIDAIESSKIGSRPARRSGKRTLSDLRAIPWVFSWTQSRMHISSWYGVGSTLKKLKTDNSEKYSVLKELVKTDLFVRYVLTNIDTSLSATDEEIMKLYADLVEEKNVKDEILGLLLNELALAREMMMDLLESPISDRRTNHHHSTKLRAKALWPLHQEQIYLLKKWRSIRKENDKDQADFVLNNLLRSINAIANAMGTTG